jgi:hypothetical protein
VAESLSRFGLKHREGAGAGEVHGEDGRAHWFCSADPRGVAFFQFLDSIEKELRPEGERRHFWAQF